MLPRGRCYQRMEVQMGDDTLRSRCNVNMFLKKNNLGKIKDGNINAE